MRHAVAGRQLSRDSEHRRAMFRNMAISLFTHGQITTTMPKAKAVRPLVEKLITLARKDNLTSRQRVIQKIGNPILVDFEIDWSSPPGRGEGYRVNKKQQKILSGPRVVEKLFKDIAPRFTDRPGGFTRIIRLAKRRIGDGSDLVVLQLVGEEEDGAPKVKGRYSRRRQKQDGRTAFAAKLRKGAAKAAAAEAQPAAAEPPASQA